MAWAGTPQVARKDVEGRVSKKRLGLSCGLQTEVRSEDLKSEQWKGWSGSTMSAKMGKGGRISPPPHVRHPELETFTNVNLDMRLGSWLYYHCETSA